MYKIFGKRLIDLIISILFLPIIGIATVIIGSLIYLEDKGPIFYNAMRLGKKGSVFKMYKFRSMKVNAPDIRNEDGSTFNAENDPRLTKIGKFIRKTSLDELPQLINVFIGNMSLVGPRPDLPEHIEQYQGNEIKKIDVLPGITGYNQAYFRNSISWKERLKNDVYYVENISFLFDVNIIVQTIVSVVKRKNIFKER